jgi:hypothetical protein
VVFIFAQPFCVFYKNKGAGDISSPYRKEIIPRFYVFYSFLGKRLFPLKTGNLK